MALNAARPLQQLTPPLVRQLRPWHKVRMMSRRCLRLASRRSQPTQLLLARSSAAFERGCRQEIIFPLEISGLPAPNRSGKASQPLHLRQSRRSLMQLGGPMRSRSASSACFFGPRTAPGHRGMVRPRLRRPCSLQQVLVDYVAAHLLGAPLRASTGASHAAETARVVRARRRGGAHGRPRLGSDGGRQRSRCAGAAGCRQRSSR